MTRHAFGKALSHGLAVKELSLLHSKLFTCIQKPINSWTYLQPPHWIKQPRKWIPISEILTKTTVSKNPVWSSSLLCIFLSFVWNLLYYLNLQIAYDSQPPTHLPFPPVTFLFQHRHVIKDLASFIGKLKWSIAQTFKFQPADDTKFCVRLLVASRVSSCIAQFQDALFWTVYHNCSRGATFTEKVMKQAPLRVV